MHYQSYVGKKVILKDGRTSCIIAVRYTAYGTIVELKNGRKFNLDTDLKTGAISIVEETTPPVAEDIEEIVKEAVKLFHGIGAGRNPYGEGNYDFSKLVHGMGYGTTAQRIYQRCCSTLGFAIGKQGFFAPQKVLYATNATREGYSVWMLPNNSFTGKNSSAWANVIRHDTIYEVHSDWEKGDQTTRVTFVKQGDGQYIFMGVYRFEELIPYSAKVDGIQINFIKVYKRVSMCYPQ